MKYSLIKRQYSRRNSMNIHFNQIVLSKLIINEHSKLYPTYKAFLQMV